MLDRHKVVYGPDKFKGVDIKKYQPGTKVLINRGGEWSVEEVVVEPIKKSETQLEFKIKGVRAPLVLGEPPRIPVFKDGSVLEDNKKSVKLNISDPRPTADGRIEYNITDATSKEVHKYVSEEFLDAWQKAVEMEEEVKKVEGEIAKLSANAQKELGVKINELKTKVIDVFANLPKLRTLPGDAKRIARQGKNDIDNAVKKIENLRAAAEQHISDLKTEIANIAIKGGTKKPKIVHSETEKDKDNRREVEVVGAESKKTKAQIALKDLPAFEQQKVEEEKVARNKKSRDDYNNNELASWNNAQTATEPVVPPERKFKLAQADVDEINDEYDLKQQEPHWQEKKNAAARAEQFSTEVNDRLYQELDQAENNELELKKLRLQAERDNRHRQWEAGGRRGVEPPPYNGAAETLSDDEKSQVKEDLRRTIRLDNLSRDHELSTIVEDLRRVKATDQERDHRRLLADKSDYKPGFIDEENVKVLREFFTTSKREFKDLEDLWKRDRAQELAERKRERFQELRDKHAKWEAAKRVPKPAEPGEVVLSAKEEKNIKDKARAERIKELIATNSDLESEIEERRKAKAKNGGDPRPGYLNSRKDDYEANKIDEINAELFDGVLTDWQKDYEFKAKTPEADAEVFDFNVAVTEIESGLDAMLKDEDILKSSGVPKDAYKAVYSRILFDKDDFVSTADDLKNLKKAQLNPKLNPASQKDLERNRLTFISHSRKTVNDYFNEISNIKVGDLAGDKYEQKEKITPIDLSSRLVEKILRLNLDKVKAAMKALYRGDATKEFKDIIGDDIQAAGISDGELRRAGIKDWKHFKELWDDELSKEVAENLAEIAKVSIMRKVSESITAWTKIKANIGQIGLRGALFGFLTAAPAMTIRVATARWGELASQMGVLAGGAASGEVKWRLGSKLFGKDSWFAKRTEKNLAKTVEDPLNEFIDQLVEEKFPSTPASPAVPVPEKRNFFKRFFSAKQDIETKKYQTELLEGLPMMSGVIAHTIREKTTGEIKFGDVKLSGSARIRFEKVLGQLESREPDEQQMIELAKTYAAMNREGNKLQEQAAGAMAQGKESVVENILRTYSGRGSRIGSIGISTALAGVFMHSGEVRAVFGSIMGAYAGAKVGERAYFRNEQENSRNRFAQRTQKFAEYIGTFQGNWGPGHSDLETFKKELIYFKKFLHGNVTKEDLWAAVSISESRPGVPEVDELVLRHLDSLVHDAEQTGVLVEHSEDRMNLASVLKNMQEHQGEISKKEEEELGLKFKRGLKKRVYQYSGALLGAVAGAGSYYLAGSLVRPAVNKIRGWLGFGSGAGAGTAHEVVSSKSHSVLPEHEPAPGATNPEPAPNPIPEVHQPNEIELTQNFAAKHGLSVEASEYLKNLSSEFGLKEGSMQHVLDASRVGANIHSHNPDATTSSSINTLIEAEGERRTVIFEELVKDKNYQGAADFLKSQKLGNRHLGYLSEYIKKPDDKSLLEFAKNYKAENKEMVHSLFRAMQAKGNTDLANAGLVVSANEDRSGTTIVIKGKELNYFGLDDNGKPIIAGDGKVLIKETHLANVKTWVSDTNQKLQREVGYMPPSDEALLDNKGNYILDKNGDYILANNPNVPHLIDENTFSSGRGVEASSQQVLVGNTIATYKAGEVMETSVPVAKVEVPKTVAPVEPTSAEEKAQASIASQEVLDKMKVEAGVEPGKDVNELIDNDRAKVEVEPGSQKESVSVVDAQLKDSLAFFDARADSYIGEVKILYSDLQNGFDYTGSGGSLIREQFNHNFRDPIEYIIKSQKGTPLTLDEKTSVNHFIDLLKKGTESSAGLEGEEFLLARNPNPDNLSILTNGSHAFRIKKPGGLGEILFGSDDYKFKTTVKGELLKLDKNNVQVGQPISYKEALNLADPVHYPPPTKR